MKKRILRASAIAVMMLLIAGMNVSALATYVTNFIANSTSNSINLSWTKATGSTSTLIKYSTSSYPATTADGTSVSDALITKNSFTFDGSDEAIPTTLLPGTTYYFSAWGYDGATYSATAANILITTTGVVTTGNNFPNPTMSNITSPGFVPTTSPTWYDRLQPFTGFTTWFLSDYDMPDNNKNYTGGTIILLVGGVVLYMVFKNMLIAIFFDLLLCGLLIKVGLQPWYSFAYVIVAGLGVWGLENQWI
jgi:hypothetical protein